MNPTTEQTLVPPRPNLGPEPWTGDGGLASPLLVLAAVAVGLVSAWVWARRGRRSRSAAPVLPPSAVDESPEARLVRLCEQLRRSLSARFGPELQARTTEEIVGDPAIRDALGMDRIARLTEFLLVGDRLKFAGEDGAGDVGAQLDGYESWAAAVEALPSRPARAVNRSTRRSPDGRTGRRSPPPPPRRSGS